MKPVELTLVIRIVVPGRRDVDAGPAVRARLFAGRNPPVHAVVELETPA